MSKLVMVAKNIAKGRRTKRHFIGLMRTILLVTSTCLASVAISQELSTEEEESKALEEATLTFAIPSQPLTSALDAFAQQTGISFSYTTSQIEGVMSNGAQGAFTAQAALEQILSDTDITFNTISPSSVSLKRNVEKESSSPLQLAPIIVTGELIDRTLQDTQTSAVIISGEELEDRGDTGLDQVIARTPGVSAANGGRAISIRGIDERGPTLVGSGATITRTVDDIRLGPSERVFGSNALSTWDLEQVEVLRGPQSTQSGRNALAGAVRLISKDPEFEEEYRFRLGHGNNDTAVGSIALNTPFIEDKLAFRLALDHEQTDGAARNTTLDTDDAMFADRTTIRASLRFDTSDRLSTVLRYTYIDEERGAQQFLDSDFPPDRVVREDTQSTFTRNIEGLGLKIDYEINEQWMLESRTTRTDYESEDLADGDASALPTVVALLPTKSEVFEQEIRLVYDGSSARSVLGFFYLDEESEGETFISFSSASFVSFGGSETDVRNYAFFGELEYILNEQWRVIAGVRYDVEEREVSNLNAVGDLTGRSDTEFNAFLPKLGVVYNFNTDTSLGFTVQQGYRAGGSFVNQADLTVVPFDPEFTDTFELSFRSVQMEGDLIFNANAFYTDWSDQQQLVELSALPGDRIIVNVANSELWGGELDATFQATDNLNVFASSAYVQTKFNDFQTQDGDDLSGNVFPYAPELTASLGAEYVFNTGIRLSADINYTGSTFSDPQNDTDLKNDSYWLTNVQASYEFDNGVQIVGYVKNLFDEDYTLGRFPPFVPTSNVLIAGEERTFGVFLTKDF